MKKIITLLLISLIPFLGFSQKKIKLSENDKKGLGIGMIVSGVSFTVGVAVTPMEYTGGIGSVRKPIHEQPAHLAGFITGPTITVGGLFLLISNSKGHKKYKRRW